MIAPLKGLSRWVTTPSALAALVWFVLAVFYAVATMHFPEGTTWPLVGIGAVVAGLATYLGDRSEQKRLQSVVRLSRQTPPLDQDLLAKGALELSAFPESSYWISIAYWCTGAALIGATWALVSGAPVDLALRATFVGVVCGPSVSLLTYLSALIRSRAGIATLVSSGLRPEALYRLLPSGNQHLARKLLMFSVITVITPLVFVVDLGLSNSQRVLDAAVVAADGPSAEAAFEAVDRANLLSLIAVVLLVLALTVASAWLGGIALGKPLAMLAEQTRAFADGHLTRDRAVPSEDEVWAAAAAFGGMASQLDETVRRLAGAGIKLGTTVEELQASGQKHTAGGNEQRAALTHTSTTTEELARSARQVSTNSSQVADLAQRTVASAQVGKRSADAFYASIVLVREGNQTVADSVVKLNKRVQQVGRIVEFIDGIADRSDLLALNAELEGTKAGDVGRGFSLVAAEMRRLSESVMNSTREISRLIEEIRDATNAAVMATEAGVKATDVGKSLAQKVSASFDSILQFASLTSDAVKSISLATQQQQAGTDQLAQAMGEILKSTEEGANASAQMSTANLDLAALAKELKSAVEQVGVR